MRVNPNQLPNMLSALQQSETTLNTALQQVSTGKSVTQPSDNPAASASMVQNTIDLANVDQYTQNANDVLSMVQTADSALGSVVTSLTQAVSLGTSGANGTNNSSNLQAIATQVQGILDSVVKQANSSYEGQYLFGGTATSQVPYTADSASSTGYTYNGNSDLNSVIVGDKTSVQMNLPGNQVFSDPSNSVIGSLSSLVSALKGGDSATIASATTAVNSALNHVGQQRVFYANAETQLNAQEAYLSSEKVQLTSQQTSLVGVDTAQAATTLARAEAANSAALAAVAKVLPNSLLNYLPN